MRPNAKRSTHLAVVRPAETEVKQPKAASPNRTLASDLFERIRTDILHCILRPNSRLLFRDLRESYASGMSPLREALMRLAADGLVVLEDHKGFRVAPVSRAEVVDIANTRCALEGLAVRLSIEKGDDAWEANIVGRLHELSKRPTYTVQGSLDAEWERRHDALHRALYAACGLQWLLTFCELLSDRAYRYRYVLLDQVDRTRDHRAEHENIVKAVLERRSDDAVTQLETHYQRTVSTLLQRWQELE